MKTKILYLILLSCFQPGYSQRNPELKEQLKNKEKMHEIMATVDSYYLDLESNGIQRNPGEPKYKHWKRWEWYMSGRLGEGGEFVHIGKRNFAAIQAREKEGNQNTRNQNAVWSFIGPTSSPVPDGSNAIFQGIGRVDRIAFHPSNPSIIYVGTPAGGLWKTTDGGSNWNPLTDYLPSLGVSGIVIDHTNPNTIYILTGDGDSNQGGLVQAFGYMRNSVGVLKSVDGGNTWQPTGDLYGGSFGYVGYALRQDPNDAKILLAATSRGIYRTTDGGNQWTNEKSGRHFDIMFQPGSSDRVYATSDSTFLYSVDSGKTWLSNASFDISLCPTSTPKIGVSPANVNQVYLLAGPVINGPGSNEMFCGIWKSTDQGLNFSRQTNAPNILGSTTNGSDLDDQSRYDLCIAVSPSNPNTIFTGGLTVWKSTNGGSTMTFNTVYKETIDGSYIHPDIHDIEFNPLNGFLYATTDGGVYRSTNGGNTWSDISEGIETTQFYHAAGYPGNSSLILGGSQDNGVKLRRFSTNTHDHIQSGDGFDLTFFPNDASQGYTTVNSSVYHFEDNGETFHFITPPTAIMNNFFKTIITHNTNTDLLLLGSFDIFKSTNGGDSWSNKGSSASWSIERCPSYNQRFYAAGSNGFGATPFPGFGSISRSDDTGETWVQLNIPGSGFPTNFTKITDIGVRPTNSSHVWATIGGFIASTKVFQSTDAGATWTNISDNLPNVPVNCIVIDANNGAYVGTDIGVYFRSTTMNEWQVFSNYLPNVPVTELLLTGNGSPRVRAATFGRGMWESPVANGCESNVVVSGNLQGDHHYRSGSVLTSTAEIASGPFTNVTFTSQGRTVFTPGFKARSGSTFLAEIGPCID